jgi:hypothetical protein
VDGNNTTRGSNSEGTGDYPLLFVVTDGRWWIFLGTEEEAEGVKEAELAAKEELARFA